MAKPGTKSAFAQPITHRGLHDVSKGVIENSLPAFAAAVDSGFAIECDVQLTSDGKAVVFHDDVLNRLTGQSGDIRAFSASEITSIPLLGSKPPATPPLLSDMLRAVAGRAQLVIEIKQQPSVMMTRQLASAVLDDLKSYQGPYVLESFDPRALMALRQQGCHASLGIITKRYDANETPREHTLSRFALRHLLHWPLTRFEFMSVASNALDLPMVRLFRWLGMAVTSWTIRSKSDALHIDEHADQIVFEGFDPR